jgi:predicted  nucleic acid-binding Zn-ribbon protein
MAGGICGGCASRLPSAVVEAAGHGVVVVCGGCARLLCPTESR